MFPETYSSALKTGRHDRGGLLNIVSGNRHHTYRRLPDMEAVLFCNVALHTKYLFSSFSALITPASLGHLPVPSTKLAGSCDGF
jgi:hypothetical protein